LQRIENEGIPGNLAEAGVYKGNMSQFLNQASPNRKLYLFDSFEGFPEKDLETNSKSDNRFRDTSVSQVLHRIGDSRNIIVRKGFVPETFAGLEDEIFSFVLLDLDLFGPTVASLDFFYPRMSSGGYIMIHDYNNPESNWACKRAVESFMLKREERIFEIPDEYGTALFRKI
jgi:O-methyltransferase